MRSRFDCGGKEGEMNFNRFQVVIIIIVSCLLSAIAVKDICFGDAKISPFLILILIAIIWLGVFLARDKRNLN